MLPPGLPGKCNARGGRARTAGLLLLGDLPIFLPGRTHLSLSEYKTLPLSPFLSLLAIIVIPVYKSPIFKDYKMDQSNDADIAEGSV